MAATLSERIYSYVPVIIKPERLQMFIDRAVDSVIGGLPEETMRHFATEITDPDGTTGVSIANMRVLGAHKLGYPAKREDFAIRARFSNTDTGRGEPRWYIKGSTAYVLPAGGTIIVLEKPAVTPASKPDTFTTWPTSFFELITYATIIEAMQWVMFTLPHDLSITYTLPTVPTPPAIPVISHTDAVASAPSATSIGVLDTVPIYSQAVFGGNLAIPSLPVLDTTKEVDTTTALDPPTYPTPPSIEAIDAIANAILVTTIGTLSAAPSYEKPVFSGDIALITAAVPSLLDLTTKLDDATSISIPVAPSAPAFVSTGQSAVVVDFSDVDAMVPIFNKPSGTETLSFTNWDEFHDDEDPIMMSRVIEKLGVRLQEIGLHLEEEKTIFSKNSEVYRAKIQKVLKNADIAAQKAVSDLNAADRMTLETYVQKLARYQSQMAEYQAETGIQVQQFELNLNRAIQGLSTAQRLFMDKYRADVENATAEFQKNLASYRQDAEHKTEQARILMQESITNAQNSMQVAVTNKAATINALVRDWETDIEVFNGSMNIFEAEINRVLVSWEANYKKAVEPWQVSQRLFLEKYGADTTSQQIGFSAEMAEYQTGVAKIMAQARITQEEANQTAQNTTNVDLQNKAQQVATKAQDIEAKIAVFSAEMQKFTGEVSINLEKRRAELELASGKARMMQFDLSRIGKEFARKKNEFMRFNWPNRNWIIQQHSI